MALGVGRKEMVMVTVLLAGTLLAVLNQTLLSPALPAIMRDLNVDATTVQWLTSGYSLVEAVTIPLSAYLIGRFTTRQLFITAVSIFTVGSAAATIAPNFGVLLLGRVLQAICTGVAMPMVFTVILLIFPRERRGAAMGVIGLIIGFAPAVGPSLAGLLVDSVGWRALFALVTVLAAVVIVVSVVSLKNYGNFKRSKFDLLSVVLSTMGLVCLLYGLSTFSSSTNLLFTLVLIFVGIVFVGLYVLRQTKLPTPMLDMKVLKSSKYAITVIIIVIIQASIMGTGVITPLYIQGVRGFSATMSGVAMLPGALIGAFMGMISGRLFDRYGIRKTVIPGAVGAVLGVIALTMLSMDSSFVAIMLSYTLLVACLQFAMTPLNTWGVNSLDNALIQHAQSFSNTLNQVAASVGTALLVSISALSPSIYPDLGQTEQTFMGYHLSFCATAVIMVIAFLVILFFARDSISKGQAIVGDEAVSGCAEKTGNIDYAAGFDGATIDSPTGDKSGYSEEDLGNANDRITVLDTMNPEPVCIRSDAKMIDVVRLMSKTDTSGLPIIDDKGALCGFISDGDIAHFLGKNEMTFFDSSMNLYKFSDDSAMQSKLTDLMNLSVMDIATKRVIYVRQSDSLDSALTILGEKRIKKVPVVDSDGKFVGTLSRRDALSRIASIMDEMEGASA